MCLLTHGDEALKGASSKARAEHPEPDPRSSRCSFSLIWAADLGRHAGACSSLELGIRRRPLRLRASPRDGPCCSPYRACCTAVVVIVHREVDGGRALQCVREDAPNATQAPSRSSVASNAPRRFPLLMLPLAQVEVDGEVLRRVMDERGMVA